jgi:MoaA/NifB/PqqE/SkfB family radical SAM enzyme
VKAIQFTGGGEPTVHPDHLELFARAQSHGIATALVTNGVALDAKHPAVYAMSWIRVSVDAGTPQTYAKTRRVALRYWDTAWGKVADMAKLCSGTVSVGFVVTPDNYHELPLACDMAMQAGVANVRVGAVFSADGVGHYGELLPEIRAGLADARARYGDLVVDLFDRRIADLEAGNPTEPLCGYQYLSTYIGGDLGVYRCCNTAYTRAGKVASLHDRRFASLFNAPITDFNATGCRFCQFRGQNHVIAATQRLGMPGIRRQDVFDVLGEQPGRFHQLTNSNKSPPSMENSPMKRIWPSRIWVMRVKASRQALGARKGNRPSMISISASAGKMTSPKATHCPYLPPPRGDFM